MLLRYGTSPEGDVTRKARIYTRQEHGIGVAMIDPDALWAIRRLSEAGHRAYVVGGAIRDLLLGRRPKDFDVATDAQPGRIRRIFRRSRIIGRRFRLVHLYFEGGKIIEVSTFRAAGEPSRANIYGTLAEDVMRRDFSMNALFYDPSREHLIDYVDGLHDIRRRRLRILSPAEQSFVEDPVRMLRAVKYAAPHRLRIPLRLRWAIRRHRGRLLECSPDRLTEEFNKITGSGHAAPILRLARRLGLFDVLFPAVAARLTSAAAVEEFFAGIARLDRRAASGSDRADVLLAVYGDVVRAAAPEHTIAAMQAALREAARPLRLPNRDTLEAAHRLVPRRPPRHGAEEAAPAGPPRSRSRRRRRGGRGKEKVAAAREAALRTAAPAAEAPLPEAAAGAAPGGRRRRRRGRRGGQRSVDMRASKESTFSP